MDGSQGGVDTLDGGVNVSKSAVDAMDGSQGGVGLLLFSLVYLEDFC